MSILFAFLLLVSYHNTGISLKFSVILLDPGKLRSLRCESENISRGKKPIEKKSVLAFQFLYLRTVTSS